MDIPDDDFLALADDSFFAALEVSAFGEPSKQPSVVSNESRNYAFPFTPYSIQKDFMDSLYDVLDKGHVGIFESPTGTGKSLSLICGSLTWLNDFITRREVEAEAQLDEYRKEAEKDRDADDWLADGFERQQRRSEHIGELLREKETLEAVKSRADATRQYRKSTKQLGKLVEKGFTHKRTADDSSLEDVDCMEAGQDADLLLEEERGPATKENPPMEEVTIPLPPKIFFCSRTHSQLAQFVAEIQRTVFSESLSVITLGSRQGMCVNPDVRRLGSVALMNDRCLELQKNASKSNAKQRKIELVDGATVTSKTKTKGISTGKCKFFRVEALEQFSRELLKKNIQDIEDVVLDARDGHALCPYYASRFAAPEADLVLLPYQTLLHRPTRDACDVRLKGSVVIIDEAHNLMDAIAAMHSVEIRGAQLASAHSQLQQYLQRYSSRLKPENVRCVRELLDILQKLAQCVGINVTVDPCNQKNNVESSQVFSRAAFDFTACISEFNIFTILSFMKGTQIARKLRGFAERYPDGDLPTAAVVTPTSGLAEFLNKVVPKQAKSNAKNKTIESSTVIRPTVSTVEQSVRSRTYFSALGHIQSFVEALCHAPQDGRVVITKRLVAADSSLKFVLLNPAAHFKEVVQEARAVILAGGTLDAPDLREQLFGVCGVPSDRITHFSCGHVIAEDRLLAMVVSQSSTNRSLDLSMKARDDALLCELGNMLIQICARTPGGVVCFFPSYELERQTCAVWASNNVLQQIERCKVVFREPKRTEDADRVLCNYGETISKYKGVKPSSNSLSGALMLSVVGGKLSEGINFSDDLGRCVVMLGMPYANLTSAELQEKMKYLDTQRQPMQSVAPGRNYYESLCMKAVNQSIGRAIRHRNDFAAILLLDCRYTKPSVRQRLTPWIERCLRTPATWMECMSSMDQFFRRF